MEKNEFKALVERYKNEMIELFNLKRDIVNNSENRLNDTLEQKTVTEMADNEADENNNENRLNEMAEQTVLTGIESNQIDENDTFEQTAVAKVENNKNENELNDVNQSDNNEPNMQ